MTFKHWLWIGLSAFVIVGVIACGKNTATNSTTGTIATTPLNANGVCAAGSTMTYTYGYPMCSGANGITTPFYQNTFSGTQYGTDNYCYRNLTISNNSVYRAFLKEAMGVCDQAQSSGGLASCTSWAGGYAKVDLMTSGSQMNITFYAYPATNTGYNYYYSMPSMSDFFLGVMGFPVYTQQYTTAMRNPLSLGMSVFPINNSLGFEGRSMGDMYTLANRSLIQIQVQQGKAGDSYFTFVISYAAVNSSQSTPFMTGTLVNKAVYGGYGCY